MQEHLRGGLREKSLSRDTYFSDFYFSMPQLCSFAHQLHLIHQMRPASAIEVGIGNGFISTYLRCAGVRVTTADINPNLEPDICAPLSQVRNHITLPHDLVICCEVLEHMPLSELDANLDYLRSLGQRLFLTLPNAYRSWGVAGLSFMPKLSGKLFQFVVNVPWKRPAPAAHFWEIGDSPSCSLKAMVLRLRQRYPTVRTGQFTLNPYHLWFACQ